MNGDGVVDQVDGALIEGCILHLVPMGDSTATRADANQDGTVDMADVLLTRRRRFVPSPTPSATFTPAPTATPTGNPTPSLTPTPTPFSTSTPSPSPTQPAITFRKTFGGEGWDWGHSVLQTADGGYVLAGGKAAGSGAVWDMCLIKTDKYGDEMWSHTFGGANVDGAYSLTPTGDGGYALAGYTQPYPMGPYDAWLIKTNAYGNEEWDRTFGGMSGDEVFSVKPTDDGGYILAGDTRNFGAAVMDAWLIKTDANGNEIWNHTFGGPAYEQATSVVPTADGGFIVAGWTNSPAGSYSDAWLFKTDCNGNEVWSRTFGGLRNEVANSVSPTADGGYILAGVTESKGAGASDAWLIKTDGNGNKVWDRTFGGPAQEEARSVAPTADGGYILAGYTSSKGAGESDVWLIKTDGNGNKVWDRTFGGPGNEEANSVSPTADGGYVLVGYTASFGAGGPDVWMIKTDANGNAP